MNKQSRHNIRVCVQSGMGAQVLSDKKSSLTTGLGHGGRFNYDFVRRAKEQPGAGDYNQGPACGRQQVSTKKSLPLYSFGASTRDQAGRVYLTREHEKGQVGASSPGPTTAAGVRNWLLSRQCCDPAQKGGREAPEMYIAPQGLRVVVIDLREAACWCARADVVILLPC